jgi:hypothetical protein
MTRKQLLAIRSIDVFGSTYAIKHLKKVVYNNEECDGLCLHDSKTIKIDKGLDEDRKLKTVLHELIHSALRESSADEPLVIEHEEIIAECLAKFFFRLFFEKKELH